MNRRRFQSLLQQSKTFDNLIQLQSLFIKSSLDRDEYCISLFVRICSSISLQLARSVFDNLLVIPHLFAWNTMMREYSKGSSPIESVKLFHKLKRFGIRADKFTYPFVLKSCGRCSLLAFGGSIHSSIWKVGFDSDKFVGNTLLRMYSACGVIRFARQVFDEMTQRDVVSWSSMIAGYVDCNCPSNALIAFQQMQTGNERPNSVTLVSLLSACTHLHDEKTGESIHSYIIVNGINMDISLGTVLFEMYSKSGNITNALKVFHSMPEKNLQSWTIMISCLANHGFGELSISMFNRMEENGLRPDSQSFAVVLSACSHLGLVNEGRKYFDKMVNVYNIRPRMEHYGCIVDMLGRAGMIEEAYRFVKNMPEKPNSVVLRSFVSACRNHDNVDYVDENMRELMIELEPDIGANYVMAASVSSLSENWIDVARTRDTMKGREVKKDAGSSSVELI